MIPKNTTLGRYIPTLQQLFYAFLIMTIGLTLGKWLAFLFDGSSFASTHVAIFSTTLSFSVTSSTVMAMRKSLELLPVCFAVTAVTSILVMRFKEKEQIPNLLEVLYHAWRVGLALVGCLGCFFLISSALTIIDLSLGLGRSIPFIGPFFSLIYGFIYPIATLISFFLILFSYFIALGPLHAVGLIEQEKIVNNEFRREGVTLRSIIHSVKNLIVDSGASVRSVLICGWSFGVIPLFCYQLFLTSTLIPIPNKEALPHLGFIQNMALSISSSIVETPFLLLSLFLSFFFVAEAETA